MLKKIFYIAFAVHLFLPTFCLAEADTLPEPMVGQATVTANSGESDEQVFYDGMGANQVIFNASPNYSLEYQQSAMEGCRGKLDNNRFSLLNVPQCFLLSGGDLPIKNMVSRSFRDGNPELEISAIIYAPNIIDGDVYSKFGTGFGVIPGNLNQSSSDGPSGGTWNVKNYTFNPEAQASLADNAAYVDAHIAQLNKSAKAVAAADYSAASGWTFASGTTNDNYEGEVLRIDENLTLTGQTYNYSGKGTLIINGDLTVESGAKLLPLTVSDENSLGIIVTAGHNIEFKGSHIGPYDTAGIKAAILDRGEFKVSGNSANFQGSFVADKFVIDPARINLKFVYDYKLENNWPPGFRYFTMPHVK